MMLTNNVAHALLRAVSRLFSTPGFSRSEKHVDTSVDTARRVRAPHLVMPIDDAD
jgi:hypothetical protein